MKINGAHLYLKRPLWYIENTYRGSKGIFKPRYISPILTQLVFEINAKENVELHFQKVLKIF